MIVDVGGRRLPACRCRRRPRSASVTPGSEVDASFVHTHVREDAIVLYGFAHDDERRCFEVLLGAHGVGPALALSILSSLSPAALSTAVLEDDVDTLCSVPGVGRKTAARLLIELKSRLDLPDLSLDHGAAAPLGGVGPARTTGRGPGGADRARLRHPTRSAVRSTGYDDDVGGGRDAPASRCASWLAGDAVEPESSPGGPGRVPPTWTPTQCDRVARAGGVPDEPSRSSRRSGSGPGPSTSSSARPSWSSTSRIVLAGGAPASPAGRPPPLRRAARAGQDVAGRHRGRRDGRRAPDHRRARCWPGPATSPRCSPTCRTGDVLFIDEIHRLHRSVEEILYPAMEDVQARHPDRQGPDGALASGSTCRVSPWSAPRPAPASCRARCGTGSASSAASTSTTSTSCRRS